MNSGELVDVVAEAQRVTTEPGAYIQEFPVGVLHIQVGIVLQFIGLNEIRYI